MNGKWVAQISVEPTEIDCPNSLDSFNDVNTHANSSVIDLYSVGDEDTMWESLKEKEVPFRHWLCLHRPWGEVERVNVLFDRGVMVGAMCLLFFEKVKHGLDGQVRPSNRLLQVANRAVIQLQAIWRGVSELNRIRAEGEFEAFNSGGGWAVLFGKPLLQRFQAVHDYHTDMVSIQSDNKSAILHNNTVGTLAGDGLKSGGEARKLIRGLFERESPFEASFTCGCVLSIGSE